MVIRNSNYIIYLVVITLISSIQLSSAQVEFDFYPVPGDTNTFIQYNYNGEWKGASNARIVDSTLVLTNPTSVSSTEVGTKLYGEQIAGRGFLKNLDALGSHANQPFFGNRTISMAQPYGDGSTSITIFAWANVASGTQTGRSITTGNNFTQRRRIGYVSTTAANSNAYYSSSVGQGYISSGVGFGGFYFSCGFGISESPFQDSTRLIVGLNNSLPSSSSEPSTKTNCIYIGSDALDTMLYLMHNDASGTCTKTSLGSDFRKVDSNTTWYKVSFYNPQNSSVVYYEILNCLTRIKVSGSINSNLPSSSTIMQGIVWRNSGLVSASVGIDFNNLYFETEY